VAVGNVSANEQLGKPVVKRVQYNSDSCHSGVRLSSHCRGCSRVLKDPDRDPDRMMRRGERGSKCVAENAVVSASRRTRCNRCVVVDAVAGAS
jgi:hypothetical protein